MPAFQVSTRTVQLAVPPQKKPRHFYQRWLPIIHFVSAVTGAGGLFALFEIFSQTNNTIFILLPVFVYLATIQFKQYNLKFPIFIFNLLFNNTPVYLLLTISLAFIYYGLITSVQLLTHQDSAVSHIILVTTTLTWTIILDPVRVYAQKRIEQHFNRHNREALKAIEIFTSTLREEIDLDQLCERFLAVIQQSMQPYSLSLWVPIVHEEQKQSSVPKEVKIADDDLLLAYILSHPSALEVDQLQLASQTLQDLKLQEAEILLPLVSQGELVGLLILGLHLKGQEYTYEERHMLDTLAPQVALALRVAQMVQEKQEQVRERERIEQELRTARAIQHAFLPKNVPVFAGWQFAPYYQPAREVGGDFYDFLPFADGRLGLVIGDVTGKGIPAALVMATVHTMLQTTVQGAVSPGEILARVNDLLFADIPSGMFVTCFIALLNPESGHLHYANAGHEPPYLQHMKSVTELWATGMPLGMMAGTRYDEHEITLAPGDSLLFYSDGLVEAHNPRGEMFSFPRLQSLLAENVEVTSLIDFLLDELKRFTGDEWEQEDDVTLVTLQRTHVSVLV